MTPEEFQQALAKLGYTPAGIAKLIGVDVRTARRWSTGGRNLSRRAWPSELDSIVRSGVVTPELAAQIRAVRSGEVPEPETSRFVWVQRRDDDPHWTVAEHDLVADVFYLPGRLERFTADALVIGPVIIAPPG
ncbi:helix-turn-helix domain-containing protein [Ancylobacter dichloromethanicus]